MPLAWLLVASMAFVSNGAEQRYVGVSTGSRTKTLSIATEHASIKAPRTEEDQQSFDQARISPDQHAVGWLAEVSGCCQSYPLPLVLVLYRHGKVVFRFHEETAIWHWTFLDGGREVAYQWTFPHGFVPTYYTRRSTETGAVIARFACEIDEKNGKYLVPKRIPAWVRAVAPDEACPGTGR